MGFHPVFFKDLPLWQLFNVNAVALAVSNLVSSISRKMIPSGLPRVLTWKRMTSRKSTVFLWTGGISLLKNIPTKHVFFSV